MKMKNNSIIIQIIGLVVFALIITNEACSQQVIKFKDGTEIKAFITYQSQDTVKYYLESQPQVVYVETMNHIESIQSKEQLPVFSSESEERLFYKEKYSHYKHMTVSGCILFPLGTMLAGIGISGLASSPDDPNDGEELAKVPFTIFTVAGCVGVVTGVILLSTGIPNMLKYKEKMHGFSFDLKCTPQVKGISVAYRF